MPNDPEIEKLRKQQRLQTERYVRLLARFAALQQLLIDKEYLSRPEIDELEKQLLNQAGAGLQTSPDDDQEALLRLLESYDGPIQ